MYMLWYGVEFGVFLCVYMCITCFFTRIVPSQNMPSSMVKYVSKKYLCANNGMRNERNFHKDNTYNVNATTVEYSKMRRKCETNREICYLCNHKNVLELVRFTLTHSHSFDQHSFSLVVMFWYLFWPHTIPLVMAIIIVRSLNSETNCNYFLGGL